MSIGNRSQYLAKRRTKSAERGSDNGIQRRFRKPGSIQLLSWKEESCLHWKDGKPKKTYEDFNPHFEHEVLADDLNLRFMNLHPILQAYFMAYALDKTTTAKRYTELKQELKSEFSEQAKLEMLIKDAELTEDQEQDVFDQLETVANRMIKDFGYSEPHAA